jgi:hypothetical protein
MQSPSQDVTALVPSEINLPQDMRQEPSGSLVAIWTNTAKLIKRTTITVISVRGAMAIFERDLERENGKGQIMIQTASIHCIPMCD